MDTEVAWSLIIYLGTLSYLTPIKMWRWKFGSELVASSMWRDRQNSEQRRFSGLPSRTGDELDIDAIWSRSEKPLINNGRNECHYCLFFSLICILKLINEQWTYYVTIRQPFPKSRIYHVNRFVLLLNHRLPSGLLVLGLTRVPSHKVGCRVNHWLNWRWIQYMKIIYYH